MSNGPLSDLRVIELGQLIAGPFCGQLFADFGAEVIKCEAPGKGDPMREWGQVKPEGHSLWWPVIARNKKSVTLNLRVAEGQELARRLIERADVVIENFRPGTMERWNLGYGELARINPRLVMIRMSGFGQDGPYAQRAAYGAIGEAMGGLRYVVGDPSTPPSRMGVSIGDTLAATFGALGGLMAIHARARTGRGQVVDSAIYEAVLAIMESLIPEYQVGGYVRERSGATLPGIAPSNVYPTRDGQPLIIAANQDTVFRRLARAMGRPELAEDERFATHTARGRRQQEIDSIIAEWTRTRDAAELQELLNDHGVPAGLAYRGPEMLVDPHFAARNMIVRLAHPVFGEIAMQNVVPRLSETPGAVERIGPGLGEHNDEVYRGLLGLDDAALDRLRGAGAI